MTITGGSYLGLFGYLGDRAKISNLGLEAVQVTGLGNCIAGLTGVNGYGSTITTSYSTGTVTGITSVGGLVGRNRGSVNTSYTVARVSGNERVGGFVGSNRGSIATCYSTGVVNGVQSVGGLVGWDSSDSNVTSSFWDTETSVQTTSAGGEGKTTAEMQMASTFLEAGWDFVDETANGTDDTWWILEGQDYPRLWWELLEDI
jgi:hypothetical protein